jgi:hypothetical protein
MLRVSNYRMTEWCIKIIAVCFKILSRELVFAYRLEPRNSQILNMSVNHSNALFSSKCNVNKRVFKAKEINFVCILFKFLNVVD